MKKLLLTGIAALFLAAEPAHTNERVKDALPSSLSGVWCYQKFESQEASKESIPKPHRPLRPRHGLAR